MGDDQRCGNARTSFHDIIIDWSDTRQTAMGKLSIGGSADHIPCVTDYAGTCKTIKITYG